MRAEQMAQLRQHYEGLDLRTQVPQRLAQGTRNALTAFPVDSNGIIVLWEIPKDCPDQDFVGRRKRIFYANGNGLEHFFVRTRGRLFRVGLSGRIDEGTRRKIGKAYGYNPRRSQQIALLEKLGGTYQSKKTYQVPR